MDKQSESDFKVIWEEKNVFSQEDFRRIEELIKQLHQARGFDWFCLISRMSNGYPAPGVGVWIEECWTVKPRR